jgi:hypothetical protein
MEVSMSHITWHAPGHAISAPSHRVMLIVGGLLAFAAIVAVALVLAIDGSDSTAGTTSGLPAVERPGPGIRYDGGPEEGTRGAVVITGIRYDGGPDEGSRGPGR